MADSWKAMREAGSGLVAVVIIIYVTAAPIIPFADPVLVMNTGGFVAAAVTCVYVASAFEQRWVQIIGMIPAAMIAFFAIYLASYITISAGLSSRANDARCLAIQQDMLSARPRRGDGPALFEALRCRAQGEGNVYAPPRSRKS